MVRFKALAISDLMKSFKYTQEELSELLGCTSRTIRNYTTPKGSEFISVKDLVKLYNKFNLPLNFFWESDNASLSDIDSFIEVINTLTDENKKKKVRIFELEKEVEELKKQLSNK